MKRDYLKNLVKTEIKLFYLSKLPTWLLELFIIKFKLTFSEFNINLNSLLGTYRSTKNVNFSNLINWVDHEYKLWDIKDALTQFLAFIYSKAFHTATAMTITKNEVDYLKIKIICMYCMCFYY